MFDPNFWTPVIASWLKKPHGEDGDWKLSDYPKGSFVMAVLYRAFHDSIHFCITVPDEHRIVDAIRLQYFPIALMVIYPSKEHPEQTSIDFLGYKTPQKPDHGDANYSDGWFLCYMSSIRLWDFARSVTISLARYIESEKKKGNDALSDGREVYASLSFESLAAPSWASGNINLPAVGGVQ
jgi:hypothetical protein